MLAYLADDVFYLLVALAKQLLGFFLGTLQYLFALLLNLLNRALIAGDAALQTFFVLMDGLSLAFPVTLVAHDVLQILVALDVLRTHNLRRIFNHFLGDACLAGNFDGKRRAGLSDGQLVEGLHLMAVVEHGPIDHAFMVVGKMLQVLIVGGDDTESVLLPELFQDGLGNGTADGRLRASSELVDQQQRLCVGLSHHLLHVHQVRRVGRQVVFNALLVAYVNHDAFKYTRC